MITRAAHAISALTLMLVATPAAAEYPVDLASGWSIDSNYSDTGSCFAVQSYDDGPGRSQLFLNRDVEGSGYFAISNSGWSVVDGQTYEVDFFFDAENYGAQFIGIRSGTGYSATGMLAFYGNAEAMAQISNQVRRANGVSFARDGQLIDSLSLRGSSAALAELDRCLAMVRRDKAAEEAERRRLEHIPADPFATPIITPVTTPPASPPIRDLSHGPIARGNQVSWFTSHDMPRAYTPPADGITVFIVLYVGANGAVTDCNVEQSSGDTWMDNQICTILSRRARFEPATDRAGQPISSSYPKRINLRPSPAIASPLSPQ